MTTAANEFAYAVYVARLREFRIPPEPFDDWLAQREHDDALAERESLLNAVMLFQGADGVQALVDCATGILEAKS